LKRGEVLGVVGESGSGKSVTMMSLVGLLPTPPAEVRAGQVMLGTRDLLQMSAKDLSDVRGAKVGFVFQDPMTSLNPVFTVENQICEPLTRHMGLSKAQARARAVELLELVGIPDAAKRVKFYPHQFSGGMRQRVMIAIALACEPDLLIADEPTTALDVTIQAQILELMKDLQKKLGMAIIWITHDLGVIARVADRVDVMYAGRNVEQGLVDNLYDHPSHPYTRGLLRSIPQPGKERLTPIFGFPPNMISPPSGCAFRTRCEFADEQCEENIPELQLVADLQTACLRAHELPVFRNSQ